MKMIWKRVTATVMSLALCLSLCYALTGTTAAMEPEKPKLVFEATESKEGYGYRWDGSVLTLYGVNWGGSADSDDRKYDSVTLPAGARVETWGANAVNTVLYCPGDLTLSGTGLLHITGTVLCEGRLTVESGALEVDGNAKESMVRAAALTVTGGAVSMSNIQAGNGSDELVPSAPGITGLEKSPLVYTQSGGCVTVIGMGTGIAAGTLTLTGGYLDLTAEFGAPGITGSLINRGGVVCVRSGGTAICGAVTADSGVIYTHSENAAVDGTVTVTGQENCWELTLPEEGGETPVKVMDDKLSSCSELIIAKEVYAGPVPAETAELDSAFVRNMDDAAAWTVKDNATVKGGCLLLTMPEESADGLTVSENATLTLKEATLVSAAEYGSNNAGALLNGSLTAEGASTLIGIGRNGDGIQCGSSAVFQNVADLSLIGIGGDIAGDSAPSDSPDVVGTGILFDGAAHVQGSTLLGLGRNTGIKVLTVENCDSLLQDVSITAVGGDCGLISLKHEESDAVFQDCRISGAGKNGTGCLIGTSVLARCTVGAYGSAGAFYETELDEVMTDGLFMPKLSGVEVPLSNVDKSVIYQVGLLTPAASCPVVAIGCLDTDGGYDAPLSLAEPCYHNGEDGELGEVDGDETDANAVLTLTEEGYLLTLNALDLRPSPLGSDDGSVYGIYVCAGVPLTVQVKGSNVIGEITVLEDQGQTPPACGLDQGIYSVADLTFTGGGSLKIADNSQGIVSANGNIVFDTEKSFSLTVEDRGTVQNDTGTPSCCLAAGEGNITLGQGSYTLTSEYSAGISAGGSVTVKGSTAVNVSGGPVGISAEGGTLDIRNLPEGGQAAVSSRVDDEYAVFARNGIRTDVNSITGAKEETTILNGVLTDSEGESLQGLTQADGENPILFRNETAPSGGGEEVFLVDLPVSVNLPVTVSDEKGETQGNGTLTGQLEDGVVKIDDSDANRNTIEKLALQEKNKSIDIIVDNRQPGKSGIIGAQIPSTITERIMNKNTKICVGINYSVDFANTTSTVAVALPAGASGSVYLKKTSDVPVPIGMQVLAVADIKAENLPVGEEAEVKFTADLNVILTGGNTPAEGAVQHQDQQGDWTQLPTTYTVDAGSNTATYIARATSFSNFALAFPTDGGASACPKDETCPMEPFTDAPNDAWYHDGVHYCLDWGIMKGVSDTAFNPGGDVTRAMLVTMLYRLDGSPMVNGVCPFDDVTEVDWYADAVLWANLCGVVKGISETEFAPNASVTREQMATMLYRYARYKGLDTENVGTDTTSPDFDDIAAVSDWAAEAMHWAVSAGLINGMTESALEPRSTATRAQAATIIVRLCTKVLTA